jgi:hypothetical protein
MSGPKFYTASGLLTRYALSCGYVETKTRGNIRTELYLEHGTFHVRVIDDSSYAKRVTLSWDTFRTLTEARAKYRQRRKVVTP